MPKATAAQEFLASCEAGDEDGVRDALRGVPPADAPALCAEARPTGETALHLSAKGGYTDVSRMLLQCGAPAAQLAEDAQGRTPLVSACLEADERRDVIKMLVLQGSGNRRVDMATHAAAAPSTQLHVGRTARGGCDFRKVADRHVEFRWGRRLAVWQFHPIDNVTDILHQLLFRG